MTAKTKLCEGCVFFVSGNCSKNLEDQIGYIRMRYISGDLYIQSPCEDSSYTANRTHTAKCNKCDYLSACPACTKGHSTKLKCLSFWPKTRNCANCEFCNEYGICSQGTTISGKTEHYGCWQHSPSPRTPSKSFIEKALEETFTAENLGTSAKYAILQQGGCIGVFLALLVSISIVSILLSWLL
ncbi:hypothetical protein KAR04_09760 [Candidatus Calescamantes bacterium]|nr:hypothetical protein [Candidatus Calescamantes bacterium]MCK5598890.1 hypothetical protein [bacterium]